MSNIANIAIKPMLAFVGVDRAQVQKITCRGSSLANSLSAKYFTFQDPAGAKHYAWFDTGASVDPAPAGGWTGHKVTITEGADGSAVASALQAVLTAIVGFDATVSGPDVILTNTVNGFANPAKDPSLAAGTNFNFAITVAGSLEIEAGAIDGDIEISGLSPEEVDITAHESGTTVRGTLVKGYKPIEAKLTFKESDKATLKRAFAAAGQLPFVPVGAGATEVFGYGPQAVGTQLPNTQLRLHPVQKADGDRSEDITIWKARGVFDALTFSGENIALLPLKFKVFADETKQKQIQFFCVGDGTQAGLAI